MALIKSISGMRGTIGGRAGDNLTPIDIVEFTAAYAQLIKGDNENTTIVIGRDGRISGPNVSSIVASTLTMMGLDVIDTGLSTTPTVEMEVTASHAAGGIIITASHNGENWNALKFLNKRGEFISAEFGAELLALAESRNVDFVDVQSMGQVTTKTDSIRDHIAAILSLSTIKAEVIQAKKMHVVVDCINSTGAISIPPLLDALGCTYELINAEVNGKFAHNPEPLEQNLLELSAAVRNCKADLGIAVDPDVDRLAFVDNNGKYCGEEYTLVMIADWVLSQTPGNTVSNLSSTIALRKVTERHNQQYGASAVGEVNVVNKMKEMSAVIGGEGNGGVIYPELHYGRDALVGIGFLLSALAVNDISLSSYRAQFPDYVMSKNKIELTKDMNADEVLNNLATHFSDYEVDRTDGVKIYFEDGWAHMRKSNTEPIIRLYSEGPTYDRAQEIATIVGNKVQ